MKTRYTTIFRTPGTRRFTRNAWTLRVGLVVHGENVRFTVTRRTRAACGRALAEAVAL